MSNTPQPPADGWQPPPQQQQPVYRPNEQPPNEEPPPWSPESQRVSPTNQQTPVEDVDGTVKYTGGPGQQSPPQYGPPPGVPVSPFDTPQGAPAAPFGAPQSAPPASPFNSPPMYQQSPGMPGSGMPPVSGMPVSGMPPVSSIPASGMPVSSPVGPGQPPFGQGQFGPQGGQLVPVSGGGGAQPWGGGAQNGPIQRKKRGGKTPMWILLACIVVIAVALAAGGFILFNPTGSPSDEPTGTIESSAAEEQVPAGAVQSNEASGLSLLADETWAEDANAPVVFTDATGLIAADGATTAYFGVLDATALGVTPDSGLGDVGDVFDTLLATHLGGAVEGEVTATSYRVDARAAEFRTFTVGTTTVLTALIETDAGYVGFAGFAAEGQVESVDALRNTLSFGS